MITKSRYFQVKDNSAHADDKSTSKSIDGNDGNESNDLQQNELFVSDGDSSDDKTEDTDSDIKIIEADNYNDSIKKNGFNLFKSQITSVLGEIDNNVIASLHERFFNQPNYLTLAINDYLSNETDEKSRPSSQEYLNTPAKLLSQRPKDALERKRKVSEDGSTKHLPKESSKSWRKYLGSLNVQAWATRPTSRLLEFKDKLELRAITAKSSKNDSAVTMRIFTLPKSEREFSREIGRVSEEVTRMIAPLIDLGIAEFETTVMLSTTRRLSIGDSFYIQIDCFLNNKAFEFSYEDPSRFIERGNKKQIISNNSTLKENESEEILRRRKHAMSKLFNELQILPIASDGSTSSQESLASQNSVEKQTREYTDQTDDLNLDQLKELYQSSNQSHFLDTLPDITMPPPSNFKLSLRKYQRVGLSWMLIRENEMDILETLSKTEDGSSISVQSKDKIMKKREAHMNPLWKKYKWPEDKSLSKSNEVIDDDQFDGNFYANLQSGDMSIEEPVVKIKVSGGILADEMGLGKTISTLAMISSVPYDLEVDDTVLGKNYAFRTTLIVCPMSLLTQWQKEFERCNSNPNHRCIVYYGGSTEQEVKSVLNRKTKDIPIVMITTYGTIVSEFLKFTGKSKKDSKKYNGLFSLKFFRIVLDEAHNIRNRNTKVAKAIFELSSKRKWALTGTPIINRLDDLYSLVKFLDLEPWSNISYWRTFVSVPFEQKMIRQTFEVVRLILDPMFLRRTKNTKSVDGSPLVDLPSKEILIKDIKLSSFEQRVYNWFKDRASMTFQEGIKSGQLLKSYTQILTHILRLRQICCHVDLVGKFNRDLENRNASLNDVLGDSKMIEATEVDEDVTASQITESQELKSILNEELRDGFRDEDELRQAKLNVRKVFEMDNRECSICTQNPIPISELTLTPCGHPYCLDCLLEHIDYQENLGQSPLCPNCRDPISRTRLFLVKGPKCSSTAASKDSEYELDIYEPTKGSSKIHALIKFIRADQQKGESLIVFSQFSSFLDIIEAELKQHLREGIEVLKFDGRLSMKERQSVLETFSSTKVPLKKTRVLLISLKSGGVGLNLTSCSSAVLMDPWWSPNVEEQAIDRIHRIGQQRNVTIVRFVVENSIETKMLKIQERKRQLGEVVVEEEEKRERRIEEIKMLFEE